MNKVYLRDFYPPYDLWVYSMWSFSFALSGTYNLSHNFHWLHFSYLIISFFAFAKLLGALNWIQLFRSYISAGSRGVMVKRFFVPTLKISWDNIRGVEVSHDRLRVTYQNEKTKTFYYSGLSDNQEQLRQLFKTVAPQKFWVKIK